MSSTSLPFYSAIKLVEASIYLAAPTKTKNCYEDQSLLLGTVPTGSTSTVSNAPAPLLISNRSTTLATSSTSAHLYYVYYIHYYCSHHV